MPQCDDDYPQRISALVRRLGVPFHRLLLRSHRPFVLAAVLTLTLVGLAFIGTARVDPGPPRLADEETRAVNTVGTLPSIRGAIIRHWADPFLSSGLSRAMARETRLARTYGEDEVPANHLRYLTSPDGYLLKKATPLTVMTKRLRKDILVYTVEEGDNVSTLAERFDITTDTIVWANPDLEADPDYIVVGQKLLILPVPGVLHTVKEGDTLESVAKMYKADPRAIVEYEFNNLKEPYTLTPGQKIIVPGGEKPYQPRLVTLPDGRQVLVGAPRGLGRFVWPAQGWVTTRFGEWVDGKAHRGIDISAYPGAPIYAADAGAVVHAGPLGNYGLAVIIDHGNGYQTIYGHLSVYYPKVGQSVRRGQAIGKMGATGKTIPPGAVHLHFEMLLWGGLVDPLKYLP